jgi:hypothetical protein
MGDVAESIRRQLIVLARRPRARIVPRTSQIPCRWRPGLVNNPESRMPFTEAGAWQFFADRVEEGLPLESMSLDKPLNAVGYVMLISLELTLPPLYIKVQLAGDRILGRSFHYSERLGR